jgi:hypothetical protein
MVIPGAIKDRTGNTHENMNSCLGFADPKKTTDENHRENNLLSEGSGGAATASAGIAGAFDRLRPSLPRARRDGFCGPQDRVRGPGDWYGRKAPAPKTARRSPGDASRGGRPRQEASSSLLTFQTALERLMPTKPKRFAAPHSAEQRIPQPSPTPEPIPASENGVDRKVLNFRLEPEVIYQLKLLALQERKPVQALLCEGVNEVFVKRGMGADREMTDNPEAVWAGQAMRRRS